MEGEGPEDLQAEKGVAEVRKDAGKGSPCSKNMQKIEKLQCEKLF